MRLANLISIVVIASAPSISANPVGFCLHSYSPLAPADKIECFEYAKVEKIPEGLRFFLHPNGTLVVPQIRYRGVIAYVPALNPGDPKFDQALALYEKTASESPATRRFLNDRIKAMRALAAGHQAVQKNDASGAKIVLAGVAYIAPKYVAFKDGFLAISHRSGAARIDIDKITKAEWVQFQKSDADAAAIKVVTLGGAQLWNPMFQGLTADSVKIEHAKGTSTLEISSLSAIDRKTISSWSDGSWRLASPGFSGVTDDGETYAELIGYDGKIHKHVKLASRVGEEVLIKADQGSFRLSLKDAFEIPGKSKVDQTRVADWVDEIVNQRLKAAKPKTESELVNFEPAAEPQITNVSARILQVLTDGVLVHEFVGTLHSGVNVVKLTEKVSVNHPVTGQLVTKILGQTTDRMNVTEVVRDELCFIEGDANALTERQIAKIKKMTRDGTYDYVDVRGAKRVVRKFSVQ